MSETLKNRIALVTGASRGVGLGIAHELGLAGATVYVTGRSREGGPTTEGLPGTIDATARLVNEAGGRGVPVACDHTAPAEVDHLAARIGAEAGRLDLLVNNVWGGYEEYDLAKYATTRLGFALWEALQSEGLTSLTVYPGFTRTERVVSAAPPERLADSHSPRFVGRAIVALASDPDVARLGGKALKVGHLGLEYGFQDVDGSQPEPYSLPWS